VIKISIFVFLSKIKKRKKILSDLKVKAALEALKGLKTINEIASMYR